MLDRNSIFTETPKPKQDKIKNRNSAETEYSAEIALFRPKLPYFGRNSLISAEKPPFWPKLSYFCDIKMGTLCHVFDNKLEGKFPNSPKMDLYRTELIHFGRNKTILAEYSVSAELEFLEMASFAFRCFGKKSVLVEH